MDTTNATVIARFASPDDARAALTGLSRAGVDGVQVAVVGAEADRAEVRLAHDAGRSERREAGWLGRRIGVGVVAGGAVGGIAGLATMLIAPVGVVLGLLLGAVAVGCVIGGFVGGLLALPLSRSMEVTFADWRGERATLAVSVPDASVSQVTEILAGMGAERVSRDDAPGTPPPHR